MEYVVVGVCIVAVVAVEFGLFFLIAKPENLIGNGIVVLFVV